MGKSSRAIATVALALLCSGLTVSTPTAAGGEGATAARVGCTQNVHTWFQPVRTSVAGIGTAIPTLTLRQTSTGGIANPEPTNFNKHKLWWTKGLTPPGWTQGSVPLAAHTWPSSDPTAMGNDLLRQLFVGDRFILKGADGQKQCYRINERNQYPRDQVPWRRVVRTTGPPQVAIIVCSGRRLGPGNWLKRTVWFGTPIR